MLAKASATTIEGQVWFFAVRIPQVMGQGGYVTPFEICLSAAPVGISACLIAYACYVVCNLGVFERPTDAQIHHMLNTAPPKEEDNETAT